MSFRASAPVGVVLAGGLGRRLGGAKATVHLNGRPMITYPLEAVQEALGGCVIVAKADSELPSLPGVEVWMEPAEPRHPLTGIVHALGLAEGRPVLICACDLPLVGPELIRELSCADPAPGLVVGASREGRGQPLLARYEPEALQPLTAALRTSTSMHDAVAGLGARHIEVSDPDALFNVNTPEDLLRAGTLLAARARAGPHRLSQT